MRSILKRFTAYVCVITLMVSGLTFYKNDIDIKAATTETVAQDDNLKNQSGLYSNKDQVWAGFEGGWSTYFQILTTDITDEAGNVTGTYNQGASGESWSTSLNDLTVKLNETNGSQWSAQAKSPVISDFTKGLYYYYEISITTDKDLTIGAKLVNSDFIYYTIPAGEGVIKGVWNNTNKTSGQIVLDYSSASNQGATFSVTNVTCSEATEAQKAQFGAVDPENLNVVQSDQGQLEISFDDPEGHKGLYYVYVDNTAVLKNVSAGTYTYDVSEGEHTVRVCGYALSAYSTGVSTTINVKAEEETTTEEPSSNEETTSNQNVESFWKSWFAGNDSGSTWPGEGELVETNSNTEFKVNITDAGDSTANMAAIQVYSPEMEVNAGATYKLKFTIDSTFVAKTIYVQTEGYDHSNADKKNIYTKWNNESSILKTEAGTSSYEITFDASQPNVKIYFFMGFNSTYETCAANSFGTIKVYNIALETVASQETTTTEEPSSEEPSSGEQPSDETTTPEASSSEQPSDETTTPEESSSEQPSDEVTTPEPTTEEPITIASEEPKTVVPTTEVPTTKKITVKRTKIEKATKKKATKKVKLSVKKVKGANGYKVQFSKTKKFKKTLVTKVVKKAKVTVSNKKFKKEKKLYVRVKAYTLNGTKKIWAKKWSKVKNVKIK